MVKLLKLCMYILFFSLSLVYFIPKVSLYYFAEQELQKHKVIISKETVKDTGFSLKIDKAAISFDAIESANVTTIKIKTFAFYNTIEADEIVFSDLIASFIPTKVKSLAINYNIFNPLYLSAVAKGDFGNAQMKLHIFDRNAILHLQASELMKKRYQKTLQRLQKNDDGSYKYEKTF